MIGVGGIVGKVWGVWGKNYLVRNIMLWVSGIRCWFLLMNSVVLVMVWVVVR